MIDCSSMFLPTLCRELELAPTPLAQCIVDVQNGKPVAGVVYENYNTVSVTAHIWVKDGAVASKEWWAAIFDYCFNQLGIHKLIGQVYSTNEKARRLDEKMGFVLEATIKDYCLEGDLLMYTMTKEQCRILNSPVWARVLKLVGEA